MMAKKYDNSLNPALKRIVVLGSTDGSVGSGRLFLFNIGGITLTD